MTKKEQLTCIFEGAFDGPMVGLDPNEDIRNMVIASFDNLEEPFIEVLINDEVLRWVYLSGWCQGHLSVAKKVK